jgi:hypothetical protein
MKKTEGQKSRDRVPLRLLVKIFDLNSSLSESCSILPQKSRVKPRPWIYKFFTNRTWFLEFSWLCLHDEHAAHFAFLPKCGLEPVLQFGVWPIGKKDTSSPNTYSLDRVVKGKKFQPQNSKGALQKLVGLEKLTTEFSLNLPKRAEKGPEDYYWKKKLKISAKTTLHLLISLFFCFLCQKK